MAQMSAHDRSSQELYRAACCGAVQSVEVFLGFPPPQTPCEGCGADLPLSDDTRYHIAALKGEVWDGHPCPRCGAATLSFERRDSFI
jgi:hypothetical protein